MASWMYRGRSLRSNRSIRSRKDSEDEYVTLDASKDSSELVHDILCNIFRRQGISEVRKLGYLNAFVTFISKTEVFPNLGYNIDELLCCLRVTLVHDATQVRAAGLRSIRYLVKDEQDVAALIRLNMPALIARSLDLALKNDMERIQAMRVCRRILLHSAHMFPRELARSLVSLACGGVEERDRMLRVSLALLSELCVLNSNVFITCGGVAAVSRNMLESHPPRVTEALAATLLYLLTRPHTRHMAKVDLNVLAAPYSDFHYRHSGWGGDKDDRETRLTASRLALLSVLRSFPGLLHFCQPGQSGLKSLVDVLTLRQLEARKAVLDLLYDLLGLPLPAWTDEASVALEAVDPSRLQDSWRLSEGFVAAEGRAILPSLSRVRPNLVEVHTAMLLYALVTAGLLEALVEVVVTSDTFICLRAAILLGELLHLGHTMLPPGCAMPSLPGLLSHASGSGSPASRQRALFAMATLSRLHAMFKRRPAPCSVFLDQLLHFSGNWPRESVAGYKLSKNQLYQLLIKDNEDTCIKESVVLSNKDPFFWNWNVIRAILKSRSEAFKRLEDSNQKTFIRRLVEYFKPSSNRFSRLKIAQKHTHPYTLVGCELLDFLVEADEGQGEAGRVLAELLTDISEQISAIQSAKSAHDCLFSPHHVTHSMCQDYFLFLGRLAHHSKGVRALEHAGIFQRLLELVVSTNHDCYVKLIVSSLDYSIDGMPRVILAKVLKSPVEASRLYATRFLLILVRARVLDFAKWGVELLVMQLYDTSPAVSLTASEILDEACDYKPYLESLVGLRPSLLHLGDRGLLLLVRFLSLPSGFSYLHDANFVNNELLRWNNVFNTKYVHIVEAALHDALTLHQKNEAGSYTGRLSNAKHTVRDVFLPPHLLGQLAQHARGLELLHRELATLQRHCQVLRAGQCSSDDDVLALKASLWCVAHVCSSPGGLQLMMTEADVPGNCALTLVDCFVSLAEQSPHYGVRATAFHACALIATTQPGAAELDKSGWVCIRHARNERFPVTEEPEGFPTIPVDGELARDSDEVTLELRESRRKRSTSQCSSQSAASWAAHFYIDTDDEEEVKEPLSPRRESGVDSISPTSLKLPSQRRSQTLPHAKPARGGKQHQRSLSESKGDAKVTESSRRSSLVEEARKAGERVRKKGTVSSPVHLDVMERHQHVTGTSPGDKSRSNSCTDSGVSSCDDYKPIIGDKVQTLSPIPSSASLSTLRSLGQSVRTHTARTRALSTQEERVVEVETERAVLGASWQDIQGFAALRAMHRFRPQLYSESSATADILAEEALSRRGKLATTLPELEVPLRRVASSLSSVCSRPPKHHTPQHPGPCYRGIALPRDLAAMFPQEGAKLVKRRKRAGESFSELEEVRETGNEVDEVSSVSESDASPDATSEHDALRCLVCAARAPAPVQHLARGRRVSTGSHRTRTDTESSGERLGDSPVLGKRATVLLAATATPNSASSMSSLDLRMSQRTDEDAAALSKHAVKKEILKHVERLSNPVWSKSSRQILLQLKQKFSSSFQDVCLYSDVCVLLASCTYRLAARRVVQELFYDCGFDEMYDEPACILKLQENTSTQPSPFSSPSIAIASEPLELSDSKPRALDVVTEEHSAASGSGELVDVVTSQHSPTVLHSHYFTSAVTTATVTMATSHPVMSAAGRADKTHDTCRLGDDRPKCDVSQSDCSRPVISQCDSIHHIKVPCVKQNAAAKSVEVVGRSQDIAQITTETCNISKSKTVGLGTRPFNVAEAMDFGVKNSVLVSELGANGDTRGKTSVSVAESIVMQSTVILTPADTVTGTAASTSANLTSLCGSQQWESDRKQISDEIKIEKLETRKSHSRSPRDTSTPQNLTKSPALTGAKCGQSKCANTRPKEMAHPTLPVPTSGTHVNKSAEISPSKTKSSTVDPTLVKHIPNVAAMAKTTPNEQVLPNTTPISKLCPKTPPSKQVVTTKTTPNEKLVAKITLNEHVMPKTTINEQVLAKTSSSISTITKTIPNEQVLTKTYPVPAIVKTTPNEQMLTKTSPSFPNLSKTTSKEQVLVKTSPSVSATAKTSPNEQVLTKISPSATTLAKTISKEQVMTKISPNEQVLTKTSSSVPTAAKTSSNEQVLAKSSPSTLAVAKNTSSEQMITKTSPSVPATAKTSLNEQVLAKTSPSVPALAKRNDKKKKS